jgi:hypothetical protein
MTHIFNKHGFSRTDDGVVWIGSLDPTVPEAPRVTLAFAHDRAGAADLHRALEGGDPLAANRAVQAIPMPVGMLDDLAALCVARNPAESRALATGEHAPDTRWARALARAFGDRNAPHAIPSSAATIVHTPPQGLKLRALRSLDGGALVALSTDAMYGQARTRATLALGPAGQHEWVLHDFETDPRGGFDLPLPARAPGDRVWLVQRTAAPQRATLHAFDSEGTPLGSHAIPAPSPVQRVSHGEGLVWLHCESHLVRAGMGAGPDEVFAREADGPGPMVLGAWTPVWSPTVYDPALGGRVARTLRWIDLASTTAPPPREWNRTLGAKFVLDDVLLVSTDREVLAIAPGREDRRVLEGPAFGFARDGDTLWVGTADSLISLDIERLEPTARFPVPERVVRCDVAPGGVVARDFDRFTVLRRDGRVIFESDPRREPASVVLADGTLLVSAGELVAAIGPDGALRGTSHLPYDGQLVGATATHGIFGPVSGGVPKTTPTALFAIDERGAIVDSLAFDAEIPGNSPLRVRYAGGSESDAGAIRTNGVLLVDTTFRLRGWTPREGSPTRPLAEAARRPTERGVHAKKPETYNPRDDWAEPAVDVAGAEFTALDGVYEGSFGSLQDRAIHARNGAVVTLIRCAIDRNGPGAKVTQGSTLVLFDCAARRADLSVEPGSALLVLTAEHRAKDT